ncbi:MAG: hypothetical protein Kow0090_07160 [Myxococcota bacterium]
MFFSLLWIIIGAGMIVYDRLFAPNLALLVPGTLNIFGDGTYLDAGLIFIVWGAIRGVWELSKSKRRKGEE